jgi:hypothetical protein
VPPTVQPTPTFAVGSTSTTSTDEAVPAGFSAVSYTAVSADEFWLLGAAPCGWLLCTSILRTTDGGAHFVSIAAPPAPLAFATRSGTPGVIDSLRFADPLDGYALDVQPGVTGGAWITHDGGQRWRAFNIGQIVSFDVTAGEAYAVVSDCAATSCSPPVLKRSVATSDVWSTTPLLGATGGTASVTAQGDDVWVNADSGGPHKLLFHSTDRGATFSIGSSPCTPGLGGTIQAVSPSVIWAVCPTGMMAGAARSSDGGVTFRGLATDEMTNSAQLAAADATTAIVVTAESPTMRRTTDGVTFQPSFTAPDSTGWLYVGFTTPRVGVALSWAPASSAPFQTTTGWRTTDAGLTWHQLGY